MPFTSKQKVPFGGSLPDVVVKVVKEEIKDGAVIKRVVKEVAPTDSPHYSMGNTFRRMQLGEAIRHTSTDVLNPERPEILANEADFVEPTKN